MDVHDLRAKRIGLSRRAFLGGATATAVAAILAACGGSSATATPASKPTTASSAATTAPAAATASGGTSATTASGSAAAGNPTKKTGDPNVKYAGPTIEKGGTLKILLWSHYVPAYDSTYFDKWATDWGTKNGLKVTVDHVPTATVITAAQAEIAVKGGHDLTQLQEAPTPHLLADNLIDVSAVANYLDKKYGGYIAAAKQVGQVNGVWKSVPDFVIPYPAIYRKDYFDAAGVTKPVDTWDDLLKAGTLLKKAGHPVGLAINQGGGDSNSHMMSIMLGFGSKWVEADGKTIAINSQETKDAINYVVELYKNAMTPEVLAWDDSGNNLYLTSGAGSYILNPISAYLSASKAVQDASQFSAPPAGPKGRFMIASGPFSWGVWNWSKQQGAAQQFIADHMDDWLAGTKANQGYELPVLNDWLVKPMPVLSEVPKYASLQDVVNDKSTVIIGAPGPANAQAGQVASTYIIPQMFAKAVNGASVADAISFAETQLKTVYK
ncbi:MAG: ABC transporter substrate-binding protein [Thermomicrobiales bacterium]